MAVKAYLELLKKQREEINNFPIAYAFDEKQLQEALKKLGAKKEECVTIFGFGDIVKKQDAKSYVDMLDRHMKEVLDLLVSDHEVAEEAFLCEMDNHEYAINWSGDEDVLGCFGLTEESLTEMGLRQVYLNARRRHMKHAQEWDMI